MTDKEAIEALFQMSGNKLRWNEDAYIRSSTWSSNNTNLYYAIDFYEEYAVYKCYCGTGAASCGAILSTLTLAMQCCERHYDTGRWITQDDTL